MSDNPMGIPLPKSWSWATLANCAYRITDGTHQPPTFTDAGVPFLFVRHIVGGTITFDGTRFVSEDTYRSLNARCPVEPGDVLYTAVGSYGVAVAVGAEHRFSFQRHIAHIKPASGLSPRYLALCLNSPVCLRQAHRAARGVAQKTVTLGDLSRFVVPIAPREEQDRIVSEIDKHFSRLDAAVAALKRAQANLKRYRAAVLQAAVEGRLVPPVGSDGWQWARIGEVAEVGTGATPYRENPAYWRNRDVPWVTSGALNSLHVASAEEWISEEAVRETRAKIVHKGALLIALYGEGRTRGKVSELLIDAATNQACASIVLKPDFLDLKPFLKMFLQKHYEDLRRESSGGVQPNLSLGIVKAIRFSFPPKDQRDRIVNEVDRVMSHITKHEAATVRLLDRAATLRRSLLDLTFSGHLVPQDPHDEPASVLLERIGAERGSTPTRKLTARRKPELAVV